MKSVSSLRHFAPCQRRSKKKEDERDLVQRHLTEANLLLETILDHTHVCVAYLDSSFNFLKVNRAYAEADDRDQNYFSDKNHFDLYPDSDNEKIFRKVLETHEPYFSFSKPFKYKNNPDRGMAYWDWSLIPVFKTADTLSGLLLTLTDVTKRIETEKALFESEGKFESMMESMKDPAYICSEEYRIEYLNRAMVQRVGKDAVGEVCFKILHGFDKRCPWCMSEKIQNGEQFEIDIVSPKDDRSYHVSSFPLVHKDGSVSKMTIFRDTTQLKKIEKQLQQAQKMEAIGTLAGGIAHDFNNLLFTIIGMSEMLLEDLQEGSREHENIQEVLSAGKRGAGLVKQILAFSRQSEHKMIPLRIQTILKEVLKLSRRTIPTNIELSEHIQTDCGLVMADPTQVHQIGMNLMTNAYHAVEKIPGAKISIHLEESDAGPDYLDGTLAAPGRYVVMTVSDTGCGIEPKVLNNIFDPYFTTKEKGKGTGLGLAVVYGIVEAHKGHIGVSSEPGKGTTFKVYFQLLEKSANEEKPDVEASLLTGDERILIIDDEESIAMMEKQMLERLGYHVTSLFGSKKGIEVFRRDPHAFDLIITDMAMPDMTGEALAREIIAIRPDIPIIICTGFSEMINREKAVRIGIKAFVMKPIVMSEMAKIVRNQMDAAKVNRP